MQRRENLGRSEKGITQKRFALIEGWLLTLARACLSTGTRGDDVFVFLMHTFFMSSND